MNPTLVEDFKEYAIHRNDSMIYQTIYHFPNDYGVSVICGTYSNGLEALRIWFEDKDTYHLSGTNKNYLTDEQLLAYLKAVKEKGHLSD